MYGILIVIHFIIAIALVGLILLQQGKGAQTGAAFGSGASTTVFGSQGSGNFLSHSTGLLAAAFFVINLGLGYLANKMYHKAPLEPLKHVQEQIAPADDASIVPASSEQRPLPKE